MNEFFFMHVVEAIKNLIGVQWNVFQWHSSFAQLHFLLSFFYFLWKVSSIDVSTLLHTLITLTQYRRMLLDLWTHTLSLSRGGHPKEVKPTKYAIKNSFNFILLNVKIMNSIFNHFLVYDLNCSWPVGHLVQKLTHFSKSA